MLAETRQLGVGDLRRAGAEIGERVRACRPELGQELAGMADGSGQDVDELWAINARTELLGGTSGECSVVGRVDGTRVVLAQNWDWHPALAASRVVWTIERDGGWLTTVTEAGLLGKIGLNSSGIACGLNFLTSSHDGGWSGLPIHVLLRLVLEARSVLDALALLLRARVTASSCVTLAASGPVVPLLAAVELGPGGARVVRPGAEGLLVHTNHFQLPPPAGRDTQPAEHPGTLVRQWALEALLRGGAAVEDALASHAGEPEGICRHDAQDAPWSERRATLLAVVIDPRARTLAVAGGPPCRAAFEPIALPRA